MNARLLYSVVSEVTGGAASVGVDVPAPEVYERLTSTINQAEANPNARQTLFQASQGSATIMIDGL
eukprot:12930569-Prorocentrum_lima.AAC.1